LLANGIEYLITVEGLKGVGEIPALEVDFMHGYTL